MVECARATRGSGARSALEQVIKSVEGDRAIGTVEFAATLKMERGRYRVKRGRPVGSV